MGVWRVPEDQMLEVGGQMAAVRGISHCYQRPTYPDWPYSVFTMAHGRSKEECDAILDRIADEHGLHGDDRAVLYSSTEFKKMRLHYFTDDYARWEREHAGACAEAASGRRSRGTSSEVLYARAVGLMPGGVNSPVRAMRSIGRDHPIFVERGEGCRAVDVDGNRYIDWVCSWGPLILGHAHPERRRGGARGGRRGTSYGAPTEGEVELAAEVCERFASVEMVRMVNSGTEASMSAIRLARAATGRDKVVKFAGAYHGHVDGLLAEAGSGLATQGIPASPGVTAAQAADTVVVPWNDPRGASRGAVAEHQLAAILAEPVPANMGVVPPADGFLELLREQADADGALLILDEVITGFRVARGGAQEHYGVDADLTIMGKVLGGGLPAAAYGGRRELMERVAPAGDVYQAGTLSGNPLAVAAGPGHPARARRRRLRAARRSHRPAGGRPARGGTATAPSRSPRRAGLVTPFFSAGAGPRLRGRLGVRPGRLRPLLPRPARARHLSARRRSSRPGSSPSPTTRPRSTAPPRRPRMPLTRSLRSG